ncbi:hypothetical protein BKA62DRAFT_303567 [Auriculariales sp. MPI-PUGE-AT-0066]|nr:hypothetical protein BKA62DRAFT_303567 [Auriculariales sp. MPI-PUGE-AT-0066]
MSTPSTNFNIVFVPPFIRRPKNPVEGQRLYDHIRTIAFMLDAVTALSPALKNSPVHVGIEPIIAASIPLAGPLIGAVLSFYVVLLCLLFDVPKDTLAYMLFNIAIDVFAGWIPLIGPVVDVTFKCNLANLSLLESHLKRSRWAVLVIPSPQRWFGDLFGGRSKRKA